MRVKYLYLMACVTCMCYEWSSAQQLVSRGKNITSSSQFNNCTANRAVDGSLSGSEDQCGCCAATVFEFEPWYKLDLGQVYQIVYIAVLGRGDGQYGETLFNMEIKLGTTESNGQVLTENTANINLYIYTLPAPQKGRYVTLTLHETTQAFVICELMVYAECDDGYFGTDCRQRCFCLDGPCDTTTGICPTGHCREGYKGDRCDTRCDSRTYGVNCSEICGQCLFHAQCDTADGSCPAGCDAGFEGTLCKDRCKAGTFGRDCANDCGHCYQGETCDVVTGLCPHNCSHGYTGLHCKQECENGTFGMGCNESCGNCLDRETCDKRNGSCSQCEPGFIGPLCKVSQNAGYKADCPVYERFQLEIVIGGTIAIVLIIEGIVVAICCGIRKRRVRKREKPTLAISGPYEMTGRSGCYAEHIYGHQRPISNIYEEPISPYETAG